MRQRKRTGVYGGMIRRIHGVKEVLGQEMVSEGGSGYNVGKEREGDIDNILKKTKKLKVELSFYDEYVSSWSPGASILIRDWVEVVCVQMVLKMK